MATGEAIVSADGGQLATRELVHEFRNLLAVIVNQMSSASWAVSKGLGFAALILASVNIFGGFLVTQRMLAMYRKKEKK